MNTPAYSKEERMCLGDNLENYPPIKTTERELLEKCLSPLRVELRHGLWFLESEEFTGVQKALTQSDVDTLKSVIKDIGAYLAKPIEAPCNLDGLAKLGWQAVECSICGSHAMAYPKPVQEPSCNPHPNAPHGFSRNASHSANRYVCECEGWSEKENIQQEPVQEPVATVEHVFAGGTVLIDVKTSPPLKSFANGTKFYTSPQRELQPLVQIASDIMGACMNGDLSDKWEDVADLLVSNNFDGLSKLTQSREPMSEDELFKLCFEYRNAHTRDAEDWWLAIKKLCGIK